MSDDQFGDALESVMRGAVLVLLGTAIGRAAGLFSEIWVVRLFSQDQYGLFRLGVLVTSLTGAIATLGFTTGLPRQLGFDRGEGAIGRTKKRVGAALFLGGVSSLVLSAGVFVFASEISGIFGLPGLTPYLRFFAIGLPLMVLVDLFVAVARGLDDSKPKLYIQVLIPKVFFLGGIGLIGWLALPFEAVIVAWVGSYGAAAAASVIYGRFNLRIRPGIPTVGAGKDIVGFSLPLLAVYLIHSVGSWVDTLVVGYHESAAVVGLYAATVLIARLIPMILGSASFLYMPVASRFHGSGDHETVKRIYRTMTKWITGLTLPIFLTLVLFPGDVLAAIFGPDFRSGATAMRLLAVGFLAHTLVGTNGQSLVMLGRRRFLALSQAGSVTSNLVLSFYLVPILGITGAAVGSAVAYIGTNAAISIYLYRVSGLHPVSWDHLLPVGVTTVLAGGLGILFQMLTNISSVELIIFACLAGIIHLAVYISSRSPNPGEVALTKKLVEGLGLSPSRLSDVLGFRK